jgi:hypothetical protein
VRIGRPMNLTNWFLIIFTSSIIQFVTKNCWSCLCNFSVCA